MSRKSYGGVFGIEVDKILFLKIIKRMSKNSFHKAHQLYQMKRLLKRESCGILNNQKNFLEKP